VRAAVSRRHRASRVRLSTAALILLAGCTSASMSDPSFPVVPGVQAIDLTWQPRAGMRLVYLVTIDVEASGALTGPMADKDKKQHVSLSRTIEVTDVGPEHFDVRFAQDGSVIPATLRLSRAWVPEAVRPDNPALDSFDQSRLDSTLRRLAQPFTQSAQFFGRWTVGETRPFDIGFTGMPDTSGSGQGTMTLRSVVSIGGRRAAAFDWTGSTEFLFTGDPGRGVPGRMVLTGREWRDLATGASLRVTAKADAEFTRQGQATRVEFQTAEVLDLAASRL
jgi:hypothetical protein